jgi:hypothetical protein
MNAPDDASVVVACSLTAEEGADRTAEFRTLFAGTGVASHRQPRTLRLWFDNRPGLHAELSDLLRRERDCCPFFDYEAIDESPRARLTLRVPNEAAERWLDWLEDCLKVTPGTS